MPSAARLASQGNPLGQCFGRIGFRPNMPAQRLREKLASGGQANTASKSPRWMRDKVAAKVANEP
eukprot:7393250-Pyramimonas_sp.AAC.1